MRRLVVTGVFIEIALLIIGLTWIGGRGDSGSQAHAAGTAATAQEDASYRIYGEGNGNVVDVQLTAMETTQTIAEGVQYQVWTFDGTAPGPVIRVHVGDTVRFTLTNDSSHGLSHSIDFHAAQTAWDKNYQPVSTGQTASFDWVARFPGVFMYHCGVPPVLMHIANGMYGAIVVEPNGLEPAREYVLVSSEFYPGKKPVDGVFEGSLDEMLSAHPTYVVFNGVANQYQSAPLEARPDELIRLWVMNAGPTLTNAFHVIGALFDHVYPDGNPTNQMNGLQTFNIAPGAGAMFEMRIPDEGLYPFVTHAFAYTGLGAVGVIKISSSVGPAPDAYPLMGDPFSGGVKEAAPVPTPAKNAGSGGGSTSASGSGSSMPGMTHGPENAFTLDMSIGGGFVPSDPKVKDGQITVTLVNDDPMLHDFTIDALGVKIAVDAGQTVTQTFLAKPGVYDFYCSIPGHAEAGMKGTLTVLPSMAH
jgi:nitrite reductase (NO-forming)